MTSDVSETSTMKVDKDVISIVQQVVKGMKRDSNSECKIEGMSEGEMDRRTDEGMENVLDVQVVLQLIQAERNQWRKRLDDSINEINKQHRTILATRSSLQQLVNSVYPNPHRPCSVESKNHTSCDLITKLSTYIREVKSAKERNVRDNTLRAEVHHLQEELKNVSVEKEELIRNIAASQKEITWLQRELFSVKQKLENVRGIVKNYNEACSSSFHLQDMVAMETKPGKIARERTYHEGEQTVADVTPREAFSIIKDRGRQLTDQQEQSRQATVVNPNTKSGIGKCLRCQTLFRSNENSNMACRFHRKGREITECYNNQGKLLRVVYKWACCKKPLDTAGCTHGYHI